MIQAVEKDFMDLIEDNDTNNCILQQCQQKSTNKNQYTKVTHPSGIQAIN